MVSPVRLSLILAGALLAQGCGAEPAEPGPSAQTADETRALGEAAEMITQPRPAPSDESAQDARSQPESETP